MQVHRFLVAVFTFLMLKIIKSCPSPNWGKHAHYKRIYNVIPTWPRILANLLILNYMTRIIDYIKLLKTLDMA